VQNPLSFFFVGIPLFVELFFLISLIISFSLSISILSITLISEAFKFLAAFFASSEKLFSRFENLSEAEESFLSENY
jgi:hypothetical protein